MGKPGYLLGGHIQNPHQIYVRQLYDGDYALAFLNRDDNGTAAITVNWKDVGLLAPQPAALRDLWQHKDIGSFTSNYTAHVPARSVVALRLSQQPTKARKEFNASFGEAVK